MATTQYGLNSPETVKVWSRKLAIEALKNTYAQKFMGGSNSIIDMQDDLKKSPGDRITTQLRVLLTGAGVLGDSTLEGSEEALTTYTQNFVINQLRHAVRSDGRMTDQRVAFNIREQARLGLTDWFADRYDTAFFNHICGNTGQADTKYTGANATTAPTTNRIVYADSRVSEADVESASASTSMSLKWIDFAVEKAKLASPLIRPVMVGGEKKYVVFMHPYQVTSLRTSTATGQWNDIQKAAMQGGKISDNPIYTGALGEYNGCILHESTRVISVTTDVYRAVLCGAQAVSLAFARNNEAMKMEWVEEQFDYKNQVGISAGSIFGMKKNVYNSEDFGTIVIATHAVAS